MAADPTWVLLNRLTRAMGMPVYTQPQWSYDPAAAWQGASPDGSIPKMIMINQKWAKQAALPLHGKYVRNTRVILGWEKLLHEYTHSLGFQHTNPDGSSAWGSNEFQGNVLGQVDAVVGRMKLPKPYKKWLARSLKHEIKNTTYGQE